MRRNDIRGFQGEYRWLSNFYLAETEYEDLIYPSSENAFQAGKCIDYQVRLQFQTCTPSQAKKIPKTLPEFLLYDYWHKISIAVMYDCLFDKFTRNEKLKIKLLETGDAYIEESNYWNDIFWGVCKGVGENHLGKLLMHVREELREF